jgi:hypothetical protein
MCVKLGEKGTSEIELHTIWEWKGNEGKHGVE